MQQVNLYQPILRKQKKIFSAVTMLEICAIFVVGLLAIYAYGLWQGQALRQEAQRLQSQRRASARRLESLSRQASRGVPSTILQHRRQHLEAVLARRQQALGLLRGRSVGNTRGFAGSFRGLARQRIKGLWLTGVSIDDGGDQITLVGRTYSDRLVPRYLQLLGKEPSFRGTDFRKVMLKRDKKHARLIDFRLSTSSGHGGRRGQ